jgi:hypothetical protein
MGRARAQQILKYGSWSLPIFVGCSCFDTSKQFRGDFKPFFRAILGDFGQFWAVLNDFALVLSAFQLRRVSARGEGQGMGQAAQQVLEYLLVWLGPASIGEIYGIFSLSLTRSAASRRLGSERVGRTLAPGVIRAGP